MYLKGFVGSFTLEWARLCAYDFRIDDNAAPEGSALQVDYDSSAFQNWGSYAYFNPANAPPECGELPPSAQRCTAGIACNELVGNTSSDAAGNATLGAAINVRGQSFFFENRFALRGNTGGYALHSDSYTTMSNCLIAGNDVSRQLLRADSNYMEIDSCTLADNTISSTNSIYAAERLTLASSIIDQPGNNALGYGGNAAAGNYRLALNSLGIDFAPPVVGDDRDLDNNPHDQDLPQVGNLYGDRDLGAYERQLGCTTNDTIYCNGFESP